MERFKEKMPSFAVTEFMLSVNKNEEQRYARVILFETILRIAPKNSSSFFNAHETETSGGSKERMYFSRMRRSQNGQIYYFTKTIPSEATLQFTSFSREYKRGRNGFQSVTFPSSSESGKPKKSSNSPFATRDDR